VLCSQAKLDQRREAESLPTTTAKASAYTNGHIKSNGVSLLNGQSSPFNKNHVFFGEENNFYSNGHVAHPMTPPPQHTNVSRTKYERDGNAIWVNV
jgi:hypothetical protein